MRKFLVTTIIGGICSVIWIGGFSEENDLDPTVLSPDIFKTVLENDEVRVIQTTVVNGMTPAIHAHPDRVEILVTDCTWVDKTAEKDEVEETFRAGDVFWAEATTHGGDVFHVRQPCTLLEVELK